MKNKVLLSPLVSEDLPRSVRAIKSCFIQQHHNLEFDVHVVINSQDNDFIIEIEKYCGDNKIQYTISESDGTPSTGKNSVFDVFKNSDCTHLSQLDGDDFFYPVFLLQVERHLKKYPTTDVLTTIPLDAIYDFYENGAIQLENSQYTVLWGTHYFCNYSWLGKMGRDPMADGISIPNYGRFVLYSKKITEMNFKYDKEIILGEDKKMHYDFLLAHQKDEISYWYTTSSDMWVCDKSTNGIQKKYSSREDFPDNDIITTQKLQEYISETMIPNRSGPGELPIDYPPMYLIPDEKIKFLNLFLKE